MHMLVTGNDMPLYVLPCEGEEEGVHGFECQQVDNTNKVCVPDVDVWHCCGQLWRIQALSAYVQDQLIRVLYGVVQAHFMV